MTDAPTQGAGLKPMRPHQQQLFDAFFSTPGPNTMIAHWAPGVGANYTGARIVEAFLRISLSSRVLVLCPKALQDQVQQGLTALGAEALVVDRYSFRAKQDELDRGESVWPAGAVHVLSLDFARQQDIAASLADVPWDLVLVFEGHRLTGEVRQAVERLIAASPMLRLVVFKVPGAIGDFDIGHEPRFESVMTLREVLSQPGIEGRHWQRTTLHPLVVEATEAEVELGARVSELAVALLINGSSTSLTIDSVAGQAQSSPAALEAGLRRLRNRLAHDVAVFGGAVELDDETSDLAGADELQGESAEVLLRVGRCLETLDAVPVDSKLLRLQSLVTSLRTIGSSQPSICIFSRYRATVLYLKVALENLGLPVHDLHGGMPAEERAAAVRAFREQGGVLVGSPVLASEGIELPDCNSLILYDMPIGKDQLEQLYGRFQRIGRKSGLSVYAFAPIRAFGPLTSRAVQTSDLEELFSEGR